MTWTIAGGVRFQRTYIFSFIVRGLIRRSRIKQSLDILQFKNPNFFFVPTKYYDEKVQTSAACLICLEVMYVLVGGGSPSLPEVCMEVAP